ncbi:MAG TPA: glycoside hydrolase family 28 protein [Terriglobales bacterium]|nr:glycoside hydrolase family 28 protein [Terriglobales bacterium]
MADNARRRDFLLLSGAGLAGVALPVYTVGQSQPDPAIPNDGIYDVRAFGAKADGNALDTSAINSAIQAAAGAGGGTVRFPAGKYLCHSLHLKSNVALYLDQGTTIIAADPSSSGPTYDVAEEKTAWDAYQDFGHNHWHNSLIWGEGLENISIFGPGLIWGRGLSRGWGAGPVAEQPGVANKAIALKNCRNVMLCNFSILKGGHFGILATGVDNLTIDNLKIDTDRDGIDIDCCRNVRVSNCSVNSPWDDAICPKSSFALGYPRATENLTIVNCYVTGTYKLGTLLDGSFQRFDRTEKSYGIGRIKFGTESNGGFKNITISNCVFEGCYGIALETVDGALLEDVAITNIAMREVVTPIFMRLGSRMRGPAGVPIGKLRRILIGNVVASDCDPAYSSILAGIPGHNIEDVQMRDIFIQQRGGGAVRDATLNPPEVEGKYPEPNMFGRTPSQGFFIRHAKNVSLSHVEIASLKEDRRPTFYLEDVQEADLFNLRAPQLPGVPTIVLKNVSDFSSFHCRNVADSNLTQVADKEL